MPQHRAGWPPQHKPGCRRCPLLPRCHDGATHLLQRPLHAQHRQDLVQAHLICQQQHLPHVWLRVQHHWPRRRERFARLHRRARLGIGLLGAGKGWEGSAVRIERKRASRRAHCQATAGPVHQRRRWQRRLAAGCCQLGTASERRVSHCRRTRPRPTDSQLPPTQTTAQLSRM